MWLAKDREGQWIFFCVCVLLPLKKMHLIWVSMYESTNWGHYFYVSNWRRDRHFTWSSETREGLAICKIKEVPSFLSYFKTLSIGLVSGIESATSRSAVKRSTNWANTAAVILPYNTIHSSCTH